MSTAERKLGHARPSLYEIRNDFEALDALLYEVGGDVTDEQANAAITEWLQENRLALREKLDGYGAKIRERELLAKARREEADRIYALAKTDEALVERLKERLKWFFETEGIDRLETDRFKFSLATNGGKAPLKVYELPENLPDEFQKVNVAPDNERIRAALEAGRKLPWAEIGERGRHIRLR